MDFNLSDLANLGQQVAGYYSASQNAGNVNGIATGQQNALRGQYESLANQIGNATKQYGTDRSNLDQQNLGLRGQMTSIQDQIAALSDPNSAYMQQSRQAIERKDAAAGRNSQWGDREVQLQALLAENSSKYAPGLQAQYTGMANSIADNEAKLNRQYQDALNGYNSAYLGLIGAGNQAATTANGTQQAANNQRTNAAGNALRSALSGLSGSWSGGQGGGIDSVQNWASGRASEQYGITGLGDTMGNLWGGSGNLTGANIGSNTLGDTGWGSGLGGMSSFLPQTNYGSGSFLSDSFGGGGLSSALLGGGGGSNPFGFSSGIGSGGFDMGSSSLGGLW